METVKNESLLQQGFCRRERQMSEKLHAYEREKAELLDKIANMEQELNGMKEELYIKDEQLMNAKLHIQQLKSGTTILSLAQEELAAIKDEMNKMLQIHTQMKNDVSAFIICVHTFMFFIDH